MAKTTSKSLEKATKTLIRYGVILVKNGSYIVDPEFEIAVNAGAFGRRPTTDINEAEAELESRVWYDRKRSLIENVKSGGGEKPPREIVSDMILAMMEVEKKYGKDTLGPYDDFEWGMLNGKLSALRWVMGEDWDMLDT